MSDQTYIEIPGDRTHELPPLLIHGEASGTRLDEVVGLAVAARAHVAVSVEHFVLREDAACRHQVIEERLARGDLFHLCRNDLRTGEEM